MAFRVEFDGLAGLSGNLESSLGRGVTRAMREGAELLKADLRSETQSALKGNSLPKAWRSRVFPQGGDSVDAVAWVSTKAPKLIDAFSRGVTIRARNGTWLAIPTDAAGKHGLRRGAAGFGATTNRRGARERVTPGGFERRTGLKLRFVHGGGRRAFLVVDAAQRDSYGKAKAYSGRGRGSKLYGPAGQTIVVFILVPQVTLKKRLDLDAVADRGAARIPGLLVKNWEQGG